MKKVRQMAILTLLGCFSFAQLSFAASGVSTTTINVVTLAKTPTNLTLDKTAATDTSLPQRVDKVPKVQGLHAFLSNKQDIQHFVEVKAC